MNNRQLREHESSHAPFFSLIYYRIPVLPATGSSNILLPASHTSCYRLVTPPATGSSHLPLPARRTSRYRLVTPPATGSSYLPLPARYTSRYRLIIPPTTGSLYLPLPCSLPACCRAVYLLVAVPSTCLLPCRPALLVPHIRHSSFVIGKRRRNADATGFRGSIPSVAAPASLR
jgi:hypothetical protein